MFHIPIDERGYEDQEFKTKIMNGNNNKEYERFQILIKLNQLSGNVKLKLYKVEIIP